jgi:hypothetical protein
VAALHPGDSAEAEDFPEGAEDSAEAVPAEAGKFLV